MRVELLVVPRCPHENVAAAALRSALADTGLSDVPVHTRVVRTDHDAENIGFTGSPTILLDGTDPFADPDARPGFACRLYPTSTGPAGVPDAGQLRLALARAAAGQQP
ncbi:MAG TPA: hypothetical protein VIS06_00970 [Mycobacteriales bacterium]